MTKIWKIIISKKVHISAFCFIEHKLILLSTFSHIQSDCTIREIRMKNTSVCASITYEFNIFIYTNNQLIHISNRWDEWIEESTDFYFRYQYWLYLPKGKIMIKMLFGWGRFSIFIGHDPCRIKSAVCGFNSTRV